MNLIKINPQSQCIEIALNFSQMNGKKQLLKKHRNWLISEKDCVWSLVNWVIQITAMEDFSGNSKQRTGFAIFTKLIQFAKNISKHLNGHRI